MHFLENFYSKTLKYNLTNKFIYNRTYKLPRLKKIILNFGLKTTDLKQLSSNLLILELIVNQKGILTKTKKPNILLKLQKGNPVGCKITLRKDNLYNFFGRIIVEILPKSKNLKNFNLTQKLKKNAFSYEVYNIFNFSELENYYYFLSNLFKLDISIITTTKSKKELIFLLKSFQFPLKT